MHCERRCSLNVYSMGRCWVFVALFVYNLFVLVLLRTRTYFYYVAYLPLAYLALSSLDGFGAAVFYRYSTWPGNEGLVVFSGTSFSLILLFTRSFLRTSEHPVLDRYLKLLLGSTVILALSPFVLPIGIAYEIGVSMMFLLPTACICAGIASWRSGKTEPDSTFLGRQHHGLACSCSGCSCSTSCQIG